MYDDDGPPLSRRDAKNLSYQASVPSFLQGLHSQVHGTQRDALREKKRASLDNDLLESADTFSGGAQKRTRDEDAHSSDEDMAHAQIVVLKEGKHLSREEYLAQTTSTPTEMSSSNAPAHDTSGSKDLVATGKRDQRLKKPRRPKQGALSFDVDDA
ncbi:hypothetical protein MVES1_001315 [Malassezia vespertilionis]|uniref:uncharacterized protein n=1 Tax=Malassezia vespertilionis TaxID=2020962 RepID=UPI0024B0FFF8|nr:uncharacterized protein MVES1_001315 [Malassezia vespertilionis]WFD05977.1 hypothetical protein MVES1_001315 [Malassezia vespertilionis]